MILIWACSPVAGGVSAPLSSSLPPAMLDVLCSRWADKPKKSFPAPVRALYSTSSAPWWWINALLLSFYCHFIALVQFTRLYVPLLSGGDMRRRTRPNIPRQRPPLTRPVRMCSHTRTHAHPHTQTRTHTRGLNQKHNSFKHKWATIQASRWKHH